MANVTPPPFNKRYRVGIDVGGTFTHAVAIETITNRLVGKVKVPTTHHSEHGVGAGVVQSLNELMRKCLILPKQIALVAHSTTQATNSLLEGDVDPVAIVSVGQGFQGRMTRKAARLGRVPLGGGRYLQTVSHHIDRGSPKDPEPELQRFLQKCRFDGIRVVVVTAAFSVDDAREELALAEYIRAQGFLVTPTHEVSQLYGVRIRTRTTAINASILPKMLEVANHTEREIRKAGIAAPFMIMRSDGGVMGIEEMRRKPVLTLLSGPAAGIAAALRYLKITDGIFLEVGGTSTDISVIRNGRAVTRTAVIGGNPTFLKTLDCRTLGVGGGSLPRVSGKKVVDVGPRSAHIAGVRYAAFDSDRIGNAAPGFIRKLEQPKPGDPKDYLVLEHPSHGLRFSFTPTCAANTLGLVPPGDCARAAPGFPGPWSTLLGGPTPEEFSEQVLDAASRKIARTIEGLLKEYKLEKGWATLVGGGGGAAAIVPHLAKTLGMKHELARDADVISAIGVALGLVRDVVEKSIVQPSQEDLFKIRNEARQKVIAQGADPSAIEVFIEVDTQKNVVRAEAQGSIEFRQGAKDPKGAAGRAGAPDGGLDDDSLRQTARSALGLRIDPAMVKKARASYLSVASFAIERKRFFGMSTQTQRYATVLDPRGVVRLRLAEPEIFQARAGELVATLQRNLEAHATYDDGGVSYPQVFALLGDRIVDLSKLQSPEHFTTVLEMEAREVPADEPAVLIFSQRNLEEQ